MLALLEQGIVLSEGCTGAEEEHLGPTEGNVHTLGNLLERVACHQMHQQREAISGRHLTQCLAHECCGRLALQGVATFGLDGLRKEIVEGPPGLSLALVAMRESQPYPLSLTCWHASTRIVLRKACWVKSRASSRWWTRQDTRS